MVCKEAVQKMNIQQREGNVAIRPHLANIVQSVHLSGGIMVKGSRVGRSYMTINSFKQETCGV
jgi:hypothetical protein